jgi:hypothetical protein
MGKNKKCNTPAWRRCLRLRPCERCSHCICNWLIRCWGSQNVNDFVTYIGEHCEASVMSANGPVVRMISTRVRTYNNNSSTDYFIPKNPIISGRDD